MRLEPGIVLWKSNEPKRGKLMNKNRTACLLVVLVSGILCQVLYAAEITDVIAEHLSQAKACEEKAKVYDRLITEHEAMLKERHKSYEESRSGDSINRTNRRYTNDFLTPLMLAEKHRHCETIAKSAKSLRARLLEFAQFNRERALELEKIQAEERG